MAQKMFEVVIVDSFIGWQSITTRPLLNKAKQLAQRLAPYRREGWSQTASRGRREGDQVEPNAAPGLKKQRITKFNQLHVLGLSASLPASGPALPRRAGGMCHCVNRRGLGLSVPGALSARLGPIRTS